MKAAAKPAEHVGRFEERADQHNRNPAMAPAGGKAHEELPLCPESGERWQARNRNDEYPECKNGTRLSNQDRPVLQALLAHIASQPEESDLGKEVINEQAADHKEHR